MFRWLLILTSAFYALVFGALQLWPWYAVAVACVVLLGAASFFAWVTGDRHRGQRRPRPAPAEPIDLAKERHDFISRRDSFIEQQELKRVG